jgi:hypothetical protein
LKEILSLAGIDWRFAGRATALQSLGRFVFLCLMAFAFLALHLSGGIGRFLSSQYAVTAILRGSASPEEGEGLARKIAGLPPVRSAEYRDSAAAWKEFLLAYPGIDSIPGAGGNPLPGYIEIRIRHDRLVPSGVEAVLSALKPVELVEKVLAGEESLPGIFRANRVFAAAAWGAFAALVVLFFVVCRLQEQLRSLALKGEIGFLLERGVPERRVAAIWGVVLAGVAAGAAAAAMHFLLRRHPILEGVIAPPETLLAGHTAAAAGIFILCAAVLFAAASLLGWAAARSSRN